MNIFQAKKEIIKILNEEIHSEEIDVALNREIDGVPLYISIHKHPNSLYTSIAATLDDNVYRFIYDERKKINGKYDLNELTPSSCIPVEYDD